MKLFKRKRITIMVIVLFVATASFRIGYDYYSTTKQQMLFLTHYAKLLAQHDTRDNQTIRHTIKHIDAASLHENYPAIARHFKRHTDVYRYLDNDDTFWYAYKANSSDKYVVIQLKHACVQSYFDDFAVNHTLLNAFTVLLLVGGVVLIVHNFKRLNDKLQEQVALKTKHLQQNLAFFEGHKHAMDESSIVSKSDTRGIITYVNDNFLKVTGYTYDEVIGKPHSVVRHEDMRADVFEDMWTTIKAKKSWKGILKNRKKDGSYYWVDMIIKPILDANGEIFEYIGIRHDITELIDQRKKLEHMISFDRLTSLGNRYKLFEDIAHTQTGALAIFYIDNFREYNDFYGHSFGDALLQEFAKILKVHVDKKMLLYRLNGNEFALLCDSMPKEQFIDTISTLMQTLHAHHYEVQTQSITLSFTVGISFEDKKRLANTADMALSEARKQQTSVIVYDQMPTLERVYKHNITWTQKLKDALKAGRVVPYYQPIIDNATQTVHKYESLARLIDSDGRVYTPFHFLTIAKKSKQYMGMTHAIFSKSFENFANQTYEFSVNLSIDDIHNDATQKLIFDLLNKYSTLGSRVVFEIVESESIDDFDKVARFIDGVKAKGCKIAIDDFGTGYSNFDYLRRLKADYVKIDGSLIKNIDTDEQVRLMVATIVEFAKRLELKTIAEFVENKQVFEVVKSLGIDYSQGYYFGAPNESVVQKDYL